jgi:hypothetical protein
MVLPVVVGGLFVVLVAVDVAVVVGVLVVLGA